MTKEEISGFEVKHSPDLTFSPSDHHNIDTGKLRDKALPPLPLPLNLRSRPRKLRKPPPAQRPKSSKIPTPPWQSPCQSSHPRAPLLNYTTNEKLPIPTHNRPSPNKLSKRRVSRFRHSFAHLPSPNDSLQVNQDVQNSISQRRVNTMHVHEEPVENLHLPLGVQAVPPKSQFLDNSKYRSSMQLLRPNLPPRPSHDVPKVKPSTPLARQSFDIWNAIPEHQRRWTISTSQLDDRRHDAQAEGTSWSVHPPTYFATPPKDKSSRDHSRQEDALRVPDNGLSLEYRVPPTSGIIFDSVKTASICRELIDTERLYLEALRTCISNSSIATPPVQMTLCLLTVIEASEALLTLMEATPTVRGVANAFLSLSNQMESAFISWSRGVAEFYQLQPLYPAGSRSSLNERIPGQPSPSGRRIRVCRRKLRKIGAKARNSNHISSKPDQVWRKNNSGPGLWEMAVLPTQRLMRYVFFFKEILCNISGSDDPESYSILNRALLMANSIAEKTAGA